MDSDYEFDDNDDNDDNTSIYSNVSLSLERNEVLTVLTSDEVVSQMDKEIKNLSEALNMPPTITRILMDHYEWHAQTLMENYIHAENDQDTFFRNARIMNPKYYNNMKGESSVAECLICYDTSEVTGVQCGHKFCRDCWNQYLTSKIVDLGEQMIPCPDSKCNIIVEDVTVKSLVTDSDVLVKYNRLICNNFVKCKPNLYYCASPGCNYVIEMLDCTIKSATCKCGNTFCLECYEEAHAPITCPLLKRWRSDDSATESYLSANTKACPNCRVDIEKNGGCPHMSCRNCKHQFCWKCLGPWLKHDANYKCTTPEEDINIRKNRSKMERMKYCWARYSYNHMALKDEIPRFDIVWEQFDQRLPLKTALNSILSCRRFLMYSYAFIYYLNENNQVYILESAFDDMEAKLDRVSVALETYIRIKENNNDFENAEGPLRISIVDGAAHCELSKTKWLKEIEEGYIKGFWEFREE